MAIGEDGVGDHSSETSMETPTASEVDAATTSSHASNSSGGFVSGVLPGVREASRKLQLKMNFRTLSSPKRTTGELLNENFVQNDKCRDQRYIFLIIFFGQKLLGSRDLVTCMPCDYTVHTDSNRLYSSICNFGLGQLASCRAHAHAL